MEAFLIIAAIACIVAAIVIAFTAQRRAERNGEWHSTSFGYQMRRFVGGKWQYRPMNAEELQEDQEARTL